MQRPAGRRYNNKKELKYIYKCISFCLLLCSGWSGWPAGATTIKRINIYISVFLFVYCYAAGCRFMQKRKRPATQTTKRNLLIYMYLILFIVTASCHICSDRRSDVFVTAGCIVVLCNNNKKKYTYIYVLILFIVVVGCIVINKKEIYLYICFNSFLLKRPAA